MNKIRHINIPIFIPHLGCPHTCVFCDQRKISGAGSGQTPDNAERIIRESLSSIKTNNNTEIEIAFFGGSFTGIPENEMIAYLGAARPYVENGAVKGIRLSTRPDTISPRIISILVKYGVTAVELGVQSLDEDVLRESQRGHGVEDVKNACHYIESSGIKLGIQTMIGLPGDTLGKAQKTAQEVISLNPDMVRIYPSVVLKETKMETLYNNGSYMPLSVEEAVGWCAELVSMYRSAGITVLRVGLHSSDTLESSIIAGPFHPAFGELVESGIILKKLIQEIDRLKPAENSTISIRSRPELISKIVGQKKKNFEIIKARYSLKRMIISGDASVNEYEISVL